MRGSVEIRGLSVEVEKVKAAFMSCGFKEGEELSSSTEEGFTTLKIDPNAMSEPRIPDNIRESWELKYRQGDLYFVYKMGGGEVHIEGLVVAALESVIAIYDDCIVG